MPRANVNGVSLYYEVAGRGTPLVLVHGFACGMKSWDPQVAGLSKRFRVITYDVRGFGISDAPEEPAQYSQAISNTSPLESRCSISWRGKVAMAETTRSSLHQHSKPTGLSSRRVKGMPYTRLEESQVGFECWCNELRVVSAISTLPKPDIEHLLSAGEVLEIACEYCKREFRIPPARLQGLLDES